MTILLANTSQLEQIYSLIKDCTTDMISKGIYQWDESYPSKKDISKDIARGELFYIAQNDKFIGVIVITETEDVEYKNVKWLTPKGNSVYIHRLAVHPTEQYKGYARELMDFAESYALSMGFSSVRLDTFSQNPRNNKFYKNRGYIQLEDIYIEDQSKHPFHCYELVF
jgi:ribosomal protein S18 acetylase RimI-like enzyme